MLNQNCLHFTLSELYGKASAKLLGQFYNKSALVRDAEAVIVLCHLLQPLDSIACDLETDAPWLDEQLGMDASAVPATANELLSVWEGAMSLRRPPLHLSHPPQTFVLSIIKHAEELIAFLPHSAVPCLPSPSRYLVV